MQVEDKMDVGEECVLYWPFIPIGGEADTLSCVRRRTNCR